MAELYAIRYDGIKYQELDLQVTDLFDMIPEEMGISELMEFHTNNLAMAEWWRTPQTDFTCVPANRNGEVPDIAIWIYASLILSPKAYRFLKDSLEPLGEFLPVLVKGEKYWIFNCFNQVSANEEAIQHEYEGDMQLGLTHLEFHDSASEQLIFKCPEEVCLTLFCNQRFKDVVEGFGLTGLAFDKNLLLESPFPES